MQKLIVDWGSGNIPWPFFPFGLSVGFRPENSKPPLAPNPQFTLENAAQAKSPKNTLADLSMHIRDKEYSKEFKLGTLKGIELPQARRLQANEKYVAITDAIPSGWQSEEILRRLKAEYGERFSGFKESSGTRLPFPSASIDELHMH